MSLDTLPTSQNPDAFTEQMHGDTAERRHLLDIADTLAAMEAQFETAKPDEKAELQALRESILEELTAENPGATLLNEVILLASVYQRRVTENRLPLDGSRIKAFGTRDKHNLYLQETYILHEKPDGGYHYLVKRQTDQGTLLFELDDQAELSITRRADRTRLAHSQPHHLRPGTDEYQKAVKELIETRLTATGAIRKRDTQQRSDADRKALFMIEDSSFASQFLEAESSVEVMQHVNALMVVEPHLVSHDAFKALLANRRS